MRNLYQYIPGNKLKYPTNTSLPIPYKCSNYQLKYNFFSQDKPMPTCPKILSLSHYPQEELFKSLLFSHFHYLMSYQKNVFPGFLIHQMIRSHFQFQKQLEIPFIKFLLNFNNIIYLAIIILLYRLLIIVLPNTIHYIFILVKPRL